MIRAPHVLLRQQDGFKSLKLLQNLLWKGYPVESRPTLLYCRANRLPVRST